MTDTPELTREEALEAMQDLTFDLYRAQDRIAFVREMLETHTGPLTAEQVRKWLDRPECPRVESEQQKIARLTAERDRSHAAQMHTLLELAAAWARRRRYRTAWKSARRGRKQAREWLALTEAAYGHANEQYARQRQAAERAEADRDRLAALVGEILGGHWEKGHPGYLAVRTHWLRESTVESWRQTLAASTRTADQRLGGANDPEETAT